MRRDVVTAWVILSVFFATPLSYADAPDSRLSLSVLKNMTYRSAWTQSKKARLTDGTYSEQAAPGSATRTTVALTDKVRYGELDGRRVAAVVLVTDPGGSGTFYDLAVVVLRKGTPVNIAVTSLGDRIKVNSLSVEKNGVTVDMVTQAPGAPMSSPPTREITQTYALHGEKLVLVSAGGRQPEGHLSGTAWRWERLQRSTGETIVIDHPESYTIEFLPEDKVSIRADCNRGSGTYKVVGNELTISIMVLTRAACPPESLSDHYIGDLNETASFVLDDGNLRLNLKMDGGSMVFVGGK
jgi:heat shock protein HslJ